MTLRESIYSALTAGSPPLRVYAGLLPQKPVLPAVVYTIVFRHDEEDLAGNDCDLTNAHVQTDSYSTTEKEADATAATVRELMRSASDFNTFTLPGGLDEHETDTELYRVMREYSVWKKNT
jgi:hypothetical protein